MVKKRSIFVIVIILALILLLAYLAYTELIQKHEAKIDIDDAENHAEDRIEAPDFQVVDVYGNTVNLSDFTGTPIVINYWASWCGPCKMEMPDFNEAYSEVGEKVQFMMINVVDGRRETETSGREYVMSNGFEFPVFYDIGLDASLSYGITSYPTTLFVDAEGYIVSGYIGAISKQTLLEAINTLLE